MQIVPRAGWDARPPRSQYRPGFTNETFLHHSVGYGQGGAAYMRQMQDQHMAPGWAGTVNGGSDIAYNHVIDPKTLTVYEGRGWGVAPGAQKNHNTGTWAVCIMGHFSILKPSADLLAKIAELIRYGHSLGHLPLELTGGHRDAPGQSTTCPGNNLYARIPDIRRALTDNDPEDDDMRFIEAKGETGPHVEYWQRIMMVIDVPWKPTAYGVWNAHSIAELQDLTGPGENLGPGEAATLHARLAQQGPPSSGLNDAQVRQIVSETGRTLFVEKGQPVVIRGT